MDIAIVESGKQFDFEPIIENENNLGNISRFMVIGMGGSHLAAEVIKMWKPKSELTVHKNYGLPETEDKKLKESLVILSSYSGNTEEVISAYEEAGRRGLTRAVISIGGKLLELAKRDGVPYIQLPDSGIQPRMAVILSLLSMLKIMGEEEILLAVKGIKDSFKPNRFKEDGEVLASNLRSKIPIIYSSEKRAILGYIWKINFNETGKIPAFCNVFPELNHNEINGFDVKETTAGICHNFSFLFLIDKDDPERIKRRMEITAKLYRERGLEVKILDLNEENEYLRLFNSIAWAEWTAYFTAMNYGLEAEKVPMIEELKKLL